MPERALLPLYAITFIGTLGYGIILTFLVYLVTGYGGNALIYGVLGATYPAFQLVGAPILGRWSDSFGRRKILLLSQIGTMIAWLVFLVALFLPAIPLVSIDSPLLGVFTLTLPLVVIFLGRALDGATGGNVSVANAYLADVTPEALRNKRYGRMSIASNMGYILGPALAGVLGGTAYGTVLPVLAAFLISVAGTLIIVALLPESRPCTIEEYRELTSVRKVLGQEHVECYLLDRTEEISFRGIFGLRFVPFMLMLYFLIFLAFNIYYTAFPAYAAVGLAWTPGELGIYLSAISAMMAFVQGPVLSALSDRYAEYALIIAGSLVLGLQFLLLVPGSLLLIYAATLFFAFGNGVMWPSVLSLLSKFAGTAFQGTVQGAAMSAASLASIVGLIAGGFLYTLLGPGSFLIAGAIVFAVFVLSFRLVGAQKERERVPAAAAPASQGE
ncbi:MAG TPA: MFS transporter [Methanoculleus sp.]|nr:MFS transporter [Methanoculleus sp.]